MKVEGKSPASGPAGVFWDKIEVSVVINHRNGILLIFNVFISIFFLGQAPGTKFSPIFSASGFSLQFSWNRKTKPEKTGSTGLSLQAIVAKLRKCSAYRRSSNHWPTKVSFLLIC